ncbi:MAG: N-acyl-D-amino-acid deacylase [Halieaceae bacterium]|jgi:N-acyl-D-amino-acid deacylase
MNFSDDTKGLYLNVASWSTRIVGSLLAVICTAFLASCQLSAEALSISSSDSNAEVIKNVMIVDGTGAEGYIGHVRIKNDRIESVGNFPIVDTDRVTDGHGLTLAPGFIDTHSHHDSGLNKAPEAVAAISQGITTIVVGNDGDSPQTMAQLKEQLIASPTTLNVAAYTGHGTIRSKVMGEDYKRTATAVETGEMAALIKEELRNGSLGLSTGLEYDPGIYSSGDEILSLAKTVAAGGGRYISHMRSEDRAFDAALEELLQIGKEADIPVQVSHIKLASTDLWGQAARVVQRLERARAEGIEVTADIYPYTFWQATLTVLMPNRDYNDLDAARYALEKLAPADGLTLVTYAPNPSFVGKTVADIARERGASNEETYLQLIRDAYAVTFPAEVTDGPDGSPEVVMGESMTEGDIATLLGWSHTNLCSDGYGDGHPRGHGAFPRAIRQFVREQKLFTIEQMIHKMTGLSALHMGFTDRGVIQPGKVADLVLFDTDLIADKATIQDPKQLSEGVIGVWVNGARVWREQSVTSARPGKLITRW